MNPVIVTRAKGKPVVMISMEDRAGMDETTSLPASPAHNAALMQGIAEPAAGMAVTRTLAELLAIQNG